MIRFLLNLLRLEILEDIVWSSVKIFLINLLKLTTILILTIKITVKTIYKLIIPLMVITSLYVMFYKTVDNFIYTLADEYLHDGIVALCILTGWLVFLFYKYIVLEFFDNDKKDNKYKWLQKVRQFTFYLKVGIIILTTILTWALIQWLFIVKNTSNELNLFHYGVILFECAVLIIVYYRCNSLFITTNSIGSKTNNLKIDSLLEAVKSIESRDANNDSFLKARNKIVNLISDIHLQSLLSKKYIKDECSNIIGIDGEWGSGKTTLIELVKRQMPNDVCIVEFNPWMNHQPQNLTANFFKTLATSMGSYTMRRSMVRYGIALSKVVKSNIGDALEYIHQEPSLENQFTNICNYIKDERIKLLIVIDDIDRMDGDEILSILKLARISGNLPNTVYLLAFSHRYVKAQIDQKIIQGAVENYSFNYIDKIVNHPYKMPKDTPSDFFIELQTDLKEISDSYKIENVEIIKQYITNFRVYNKIYNIVALDYENYKSQIHLEDFIVLKTLQNCHIELYTALIESIKEANLKIDTNLSPENGFKNAKNNNTSFFEKNGITNESDLIIFYIKGKTEKRNISFNDNLMSDYINRNTKHRKYLRKRLMISALKIDDNSFESNVFDSLEFSYENIRTHDSNYESTLEGWLNNHNYPKTETNFISDFLFNKEAILPKDKNIYINGILYALFLFKKNNEGGEIVVEKINHLWVDLVDFNDSYTFDYFLELIRYYSIYFNDKYTYDAIFSPFKDNSSPIGISIYDMYKDKISNMISGLRDDFEKVKPVKSLLN